MGNSVSVFESVEFGSVRTTVVDGEPMFVGADVAKALGYSRPSEAVTDHCKGTAKQRILTNGGEQDMNVIPERDVYRLIMRSKLPAAEKFEEWVVGDVLPSIRKNGGYIQENRAIDLVAKWMPNLDPASQQFVANMMEENMAKEKALKEHKEVIDTQSIVITEQTKEIEYRGEVIEGCVGGVDIYTMRTVLNRVCKHTKNYGNIQNRYNEMYRSFREINSIDLKARCDGYNRKQDKKKDHLSVVKYAEQFGFIRELYAVAVKLFETDVNEILDDIRRNTSK